MRTTWAIMPNGKLKRLERRIKGACFIPALWVDDIRNRVGLGTKFVYSALRISQYK